MSTLNELLDEASQEEVKPPASQPPPSEWQIKEDPASGVPRTVNTVTGEVKIEVENNKGELVKTKSQPLPNQQQSPTLQEVRPGLA